MNYVLKNEQLFIELCRGPDFNWESGVAILFSQYLNSEKRKVFYKTGSTAISFNSEVTVSVMCLYERFGGAHNPQVALG